MARVTNWCCCMCLGSSERNIVWMASFCMIQGLIWSALSVFFLAVQTCALKFETFETANLTNAPNEIVYVQNLVYAAYLSGNCYPQQQDEWPIKSATQERTYNLLVIHGFLNALWIPVCVLLIVGVRSRFRGCWVATLLYTPWLLITFVVILFDIVASSFYVLDERHTRSLLEFVVYIGFEIYSKDFIVSKSFVWDSYTVYAPFFFILFFTKGIIFTILNTIFFVQIFRLTHYIGRERSQTLLSTVDTYDDTGISKYKNVDENIPMQVYSSGSYLQWMEIYQPTDHHYEIIITPRKEYAMDNLFPTKTVPEFVSHTRESQSPDYLSLLNYSSEYQYAYENIWRDIKKENIANVTHIYDYLGRPVAESKVAIKNTTTKDVNLRKGSMLSSMDLIQIEKIVNHNQATTTTYGTMKRSQTTTALSGEICGLSDRRLSKSNGAMTIDENDPPSRNVSPVYETIADLKARSDFNLQAGMSNSNNCDSQSSSSNLKGEVEIDETSKVLNNQTSSHIAAGNINNIVTITNSFPSYTNLPNYQDTLNKKTKEKPVLQKLLIPEASSNQDTNTQLDNSPKDGKSVEGNTFKLSNDSYDRRKYKR